MKLPKKMIGWALVVVAVLYLVVSLFTAKTEDKNSDSHNQTATTYGNNSPAVQVQNVNVFQVSQNGLKEYAAESYDKLIQKYPSGFILLGLENGKLIYEPRLKTVEVSADWDNATLAIFPSQKVGTLTIPKFHIISESAHLRVNMSAGEGAVLHFHLIENQPVQFSGLPQLNLEILDLTKGIFLIGFNPNWPK